MIDDAVARFRAATLREIRSFFDSHGYLEVDGPVLVDELIPEAHIEVFETKAVHPYGEERSRFLTPSPEVWMKRLIARGYRDIYYLGKAFRNAESTSRTHRPEFTMLEWYTVDADHTDQAGLTARLLSHLASRLQGAGSDRLAASPVYLTVAESIEAYAGVRPDFGRDGSMRACAKELEMRIGPDESDEDLFQRVLLTLVEPRLPTDRPVFLTDYPAVVPTLARRRGATADRWELYLDGMEIANCYAEETDRSKLEEFLRAEAERKRRALVPHPPALNLLEFADAPACSGVALGVDRLIMALLEIRDIGGVIFFP